MQDAKPAAVEEEEIPLGAQGQWKGEGHGGGAQGQDEKICRLDLLLSLPSLGSARLGWGSRLPGACPFCTPARHSGKQPGRGEKTEKS